MTLSNSIFSKHFSAMVAVAVLIFAGLACSSKSDSEWQRELGGKKLSRAKTSGSISDKVNIWFCPSGEYVMQTQFSGFSTGGGGTLSMADEDLEYGRWRVDSGTLTLQSENKGTKQYGISEGLESNVVYLDGDGYLLEAHSECP